jgi:hypothetical protein
LDAEAWIIFAASPAQHPYSASKLADFDAEVCSVDDELAGHVRLPATVEHGLKKKSR